MANFVDAHKDQIFVVATENLMGQLDGIAEKIEERLAKAVDEVLAIVRDNFSTLWEKSGYPDAKTLALRKLVLEAINAELVKVNGVLSTSEEAPLPQDYAEESEEEEIVPKKKPAKAPKADKSGQKKLDLKTTSKTIVIFSDGEDAEMDVVAPAPSPSKRSPAKSRSPAKRWVIDLD